MPPESDTDARQNDSRSGVRATALDGGAGAANNEKVASRSTRPRKDPDDRSPAVLSVLQRDRPAARPGAGEPAGRLPAVRRILSPACERRPGTGRAIRGRDRGSGRGAAAAAGGAGSRGEALDPAGGGRRGGAGPARD